MSRETPLYIKNNHLIRVNISDIFTDEIIPGGECFLTIKDSATNNPVSGFNWPLALLEDTDVPGLYKSVIPANLVISNSQKLYAEISFLSDGNTSTWVMDLKAQFRKPNNTTSVSTV